MSEGREDQISQWLKKLERESWQLELLVSAFTIFLLIQAIGVFSDLIQDLRFTYNLSDGLLSFIFVFLATVALSVRALAFFLIIHLLLRGFWIGAIGLRSVQSSIDFEKLKYSEFFTEKLKKRVVSLDNLVIMLDEICSLIFSFAFLVISILISFSLYLLFLGVISFSLGSLISLTSSILNSILTAITVITVLLYLLAGLIYLIDYFTLGFFKKFKIISKIYYPFYRLLGAITLSVISRSIYYYLISKFSKKRIRLVYGIALLFVFLSSAMTYDQYQFYPNEDDEFTLETNRYDDLRSPDKHILDVSIPSKFISNDYLELFIRYNPKDNELIRSNCPDYEPVKSDGINWKLKLITKGGSFIIGTNDFSGEDKSKLLSCLSETYQVSINDSIYQDLKFYYHQHNSKKQKGIITMIPTEYLPVGENILKVEKKSVDDSSKVILEGLAGVPFWLSKK